MDVVPIYYPQMSNEDYDDISKFNRLHQELFDLLCKMTGLPPELLQPKAHLSKHADLVENHLYSKALDCRLNKAR